MEQQAMPTMPAAHRRLRKLGSHLASAGAAAAGAAAAAAQAEPITEQAALLPDADAVLGWPALSLPAPEYRVVPRLEPGSPEVSAHLEEFGFAVVTVMTPAEVEQALERVWGLIEGQGTGVDRHSSSTWTNERWSPRTASKPQAIAGSGAGAGGHGMLQSDALWYIRSRPGLRKAWEGIYGTEDLIVSFDGLNVVRPWSKDPTWRVTAQGPHIDGVRQMPASNAGARLPDGEAAFDPKKRYYAQGVVNLIQSSADSGGNVVVAKSHKHYETLSDEFFSKRESGNQGITPEIVAAHPEIFEGNVIIAHVEPGDAVLWDDRAIHCNHPGVTGTLPARGGLLRAAAYVTMAPAATAVAEVLESRKRCIAEGWSSGSGGWCAHRMIDPEPGQAGSVDHDSPRDADSSGGFCEAPRAVLGPVEMKLVAGSR
jgi:hypothetical protein